MFLLLLPELEKSWETEPTTAQYIGGAVILAIFFYYGIKAIKKNKIHRCMPNWFLILAVMTMPIIGAVNLIRQMLKVEIFEVTRNEALVFSYSATAFFLINLIVLAVHQRLVRRAESKQAGVSK